MDELEIKEIAFHFQLEWDEIIYELENGNNI